MSKKRKVVNLRLPKETIRVIDELAAQGLLGETREEVLLHILRQHIFVTMTRAVPRAKP